MMNIIASSPLLSTASMPVLGYAILHFLLFLIAFEGLLCLAAQLFTKAASRDYLYTAKVFAIAIVLGIVLAFASEAIVTHLLWVDYRRNLKG